MDRFGNARPPRGVPASLARAAGDLARCLRFSTRLAVPVLPGEADPYAAPGLRTMLRMWPLAGAVIGAGAACVVSGALALDLGPLLSATLAVAALTLMTGALHEDALADTADGFGGGTTPERRLEIMRDSRIGSFGAAALILGLGLRVAALAALADRLGPVALGGAVVFAAALSRAAALGVFRLPPARAGGMSHALGPGTQERLWAAFMVPVLIAGILGLLGLLPWPGLALGFAAAVAAAAGMARLALRLVGGHTGDVAGAAQQLCEIAALIGLLIAVPR